MSPTDLPSPFTPGPQRAWASSPSPSCTNLLNVSGPHIGEDRQTPPSLSASGLHGWVLKVATIFRVASIPCDCTEMAATYDVVMQPSNEVICFGNFCSTMQTTLGKQHIASLPRWATHKFNKYHSWISDY